MCYSAQVIQDYRDYIRRYGADIDIKTFYNLYWRRSQGEKIKIPKAMDALFVGATAGQEGEIAQMIQAFNDDQVMQLEQELFIQRKRLADAERKLAVKTTKAAEESQRIATKKDKWIRSKLDDIKRESPAEKDARIFPMAYAPVIMLEDGRRVMRPMRYGCLPADKPAFFEKKYPGTYNARRDNLEGYWKQVFGYTHGIMIINAFFENVSRHAMEGRELAPEEKEENVELEFRPQPRQDMLVACLWAHRANTAEEDLWSFAAITDEPPAEVAAAGHDRCIIPIQEAAMDAWLNPDPKATTASYAILDDRARPYFEHRKAA